MKIQRRKGWVWPDPLIVLSVVGVLAISLVLLASVSGRMAHLGLEHNYFWRQFFWAGVGFVVMMVVGSLDYRHVGAVAPFLYAAALVLLALVFVIGSRISGSQRWISLGFMSLQPSEFMKPMTVLMLAWYFDQVQGRLGVREFLLSSLIVFIPFIMVAKQPDLGTALVFSVVYVATLFVLGLPMKFFYLFGGLGVLASPLAWMLLKDYQKQRIYVFLDPYNDQFGSGWPIIQSKIAIGSGEFFGKGFGRGTQTQLDFLPERHTDFIFSVLGEEWGYFGALVLFILYFILISRSMQIALKTPDPLGRVMVIGIVTMIAFQFIINVGMTFGFFPITGLPLPFLSYGGSSMVTLLLAVGLILSVGRANR